MLWFVGLDGDGGDAGDDGGLVKGVGFAALTAMELVLSPVFSMACHKYERSNVCQSIQRKIMINRLSKCFECLPATMDISQKIIVLHEL